MFGVGITPPHPPTGAPKKSPNIKGTGVQFQSSLLKSFSFLHKLFIINGLQTNS